MYTKPFSQAGIREEKPPLKLHYRLSLSRVPKTRVNTAYRSWGTKERERDWESERGKSLYFFLRSLAREFKKKMDIWASPKSVLLSKTEKTLWTIINGLENTFSSLSDGHQSKVNYATIIKCKIRSFTLRGGIQVRPLHTGFFHRPHKGKTSLVPLSSPPPHPRALENSRQFAAPHWFSR